MTLRSWHARSWIAGKALLAVLALGATACAGGPASARYNPATLQSDVSNAYMTVFNMAYSKNVSSKVKTIQDGTSIRVALAQLLSNRLSNTLVGVQIHGVMVPSSSVCHQQKVPAPCATVRYIFISAVSGPQLDNTGYATFQNGHWLVAKVTVCDLLSNFYVSIRKVGSVPGC